MTSQTSARYRILLPAYAPGCTVVAERAWNDRIKIAFDRGTATVPRRRSLDAYLRSLSRGGWLQRSSSQDFAHKYRIEHPSGLFTAALRFSRRHNDPDGQWSIQMMLEVNPTRMFAACECDLDLLRNHTVSSISELPDGLQADIMLETLDETDNCIPDRLIQRARRANPADVTRASIQATWRMIEQVLVPPGSGEARHLGDQGSAWDRDDRPAGLVEADQYAIAPIMFDFAWNRWAVKQLETYWEFTNEDALGVVEAVIARGQEIVEGVHLREYHISTSARERERNAQSAIFPLGREGVVLAVYAKTPTRTRFEVRHTRNPRSIYGHKPEVQALQTTSRGNLFELINLVSSEAATRMNAFLTELAYQEVRPSPHMTRLSTFLFHVATACGNSPTLIMRVLSPLVRYGRISRSGPPEVQAALDNLVETGVLRRARPGTRAQRTNLTLTRRFQEVVDRVRHSL